MLLHASGPMWRQHHRHQIWRAWQQRVPRHPWCYLADQPIKTTVSVQKHGASGSPCNGAILMFKSSLWYVLKVARKLEQSLQRRGSETAACQVRRPWGERRRSADEEMPSEKEQRIWHRQLSLRRHRWCTESFIFGKFEGFPTSGKHQSCVWSVHDVMLCGSCKARDNSKVWLRFFYWKLDDKCNICEERRFFLCDCPYFFSFHFLYLSTNF